MDYFLMKRAVVGRVPMMCDIRKILQFFKWQSTTQTLTTRTYTQLSL
jgi:hypothetical protein